MSEGPWQPTASLKAIQSRAECLRIVRDFFSQRDVLEVETPLLSACTVTAPHLDSFSVDSELQRFLQTSPEYAMKRLLAAGSGSIYQICKAFRRGECGQFHNPEFTLVEWYRVGFTIEALMDEVESLLQALLGVKRCRRRAYRSVFEEKTGLDPFRAETPELADVAQRLTAVPEGGLERRVDWLEWLFACLVQPELGREEPLFVFDFPRELAQLSRVRDSEDGTSVATRFELFVKGVELANGFHELADASEQGDRFDEDNRMRREMLRPERELDRRLLAALDSGVPDSSGVALGLDRLLMLKMGVDSLSEVIGFDWMHA